MRITPAYTGNTKRRTGGSARSQDHPRIHGEHQVPVWSMKMRTGSPPHTRGTRRPILVVGILWRITPAYTGNTGSLFFGEDSTKDHPRIHGEHCMFTLPPPLLKGSPPHTRGTLNHCSGYNCDIRITPAYTGNTSSSSAFCCL